MEKSDGVKNVCGNIETVAAGKRNRTNRAGKEIGRRRIGDKSLEGRVRADTIKLAAIADYFGVTTDFLVGAKNQIFLTILALATR